MSIASEDRPVWDTSDLEGESDRPHSSLADSDEELAAAADRIAVLGHKLDTDTPARYIECKLRNYTTSHIAVGNTTSPESRRDTKETKSNIALFPAIAPGSDERNEKYLRSRSFGRRCCRIS